MTGLNLLQAIVNGLISGAQIALPAIGLTAIFAISRYLNFMIGSIATVGAYAGSMVAVNLGWPLPAALLFAGVVGGVVGLAFEKTAVRPLSSGGPLMMTVSAMGVSMVLENLLRFFFGNDPRAFAEFTDRDLWLSGIRIGPQQISNVIVVAGVLAVVWAGLNFSRLGRSMRAVADNPDLARLKGIDPKRVADVTILVSMALVGLGGALIAVDSSVDPLIGSRVIFSVFAAVVLGGIGSLPGAVLGAIAIGVAEELAVTFGSPAYRLVVSFAVILLVLTFRPRGMLGASSR